MKILLIILALFLFGCSSDNKDIFEKYSDGSPKAVRFYKNSKDKSVYQLVWYFPDGKVQFEGMVKENKFFGSKINYYNNGNFKEVDSLINPCELNVSYCDSKVFLFDSSGKKIEEFENRNGSENGLSIKFDTAGRIKEKFELVDGHITGQGLKYFANGKVAFKATFKNDSIQGYAVYFYDNGNTMKMMQYNGEKMALPYFKWFENGEILKGEAINNERQILWTWMDKNRNIIKTKTVNFGSQFMVPE